MEYGLRKYEAALRLLWFLFFLLCLAVAYPVARGYGLDCFGLSTQQGPFLTDFKSTAFWMQCSWLRIPPLGTFTAYIIWVALLFLGGRLAWLLLQLVGKHLVSGLLAANLTKGEGRPKPAHNASSADLERSFPSELLFRKVNHLPLQLLFHAFQRLRLMLPNPRGTISSEDMVERERRIVETDWHILWSSWTPYRWLIWLLPLLGLAQAVWLLYSHLQPALSGQKDLQDLLGPVLTSLLPLVQLVIAAVVLSLASGLLKRFENLYLTSVDGMLYDQFLSRLPFQSSDTLIILQAMERQFRELRSLLKRFEQSRSSEEKPPGDRS